MIAQPFILHALSPLHVGIGQAAEIIDLPIARLKGTGIPFVPGSSIKGVLREARRGIRSMEDTAERNSDDPPDVQAVFGPGTQDAGKHAGALVCADARLLALPVRSFRGTFAYVTSPLLLALASRDLATPPPIPSIASGCCMAGPALALEQTVFLEDLDLKAVPTDKMFAAWQSRLASVFDSHQEAFTGRFAVVDDEVMTFLWETATQIDQRVAIDPATRTAKTGALWIEESLPCETLLIGLLLAEGSRRAGVIRSATEVIDFALPGTGATLQFGGKASVGRGRCRMVRL